MKVRGRAWVLGDRVTTDDIISGKYKYQKMDDLKALLPYVFADVIPGFHEKVRPGDVIVAGKGFGYGSSREHAARLLKLAGIGAVVAESFHRIFYRNAVNVGLPVVEARVIPRVTRQGDTILVDLEEGVIVNETRGVEERFTPPPPFILEVVRAGGLVEYVKRTGRLPWE